MNPANKLFRNENFWSPRLEQAHTHCPEATNHAQRGNEIGKCSKVKGKQSLTERQLESKFPEKSNGLGFHVQQKRNETMIDLLLQF